MQKSRHNKQTFSCFFFFCFQQARKILRELKYQKRCEEAVTTITAYWHGTQVLTYASAEGYQRVKCLPQQSVSLGLIQAFYSCWIKNCSWSPYQYYNTFSSYAVFLPNGPTVLHKFCSLTKLSLILLLLFPFDPASFADHTTVTFLS